MIACHCGRDCVYAVYVQDGLVSGGEGEEDGEGSALAGLAPAHEDAAHVVLLHDAFCECEAETPAALLGGVAGVEHRLLVFAWYAFACVGDGDLGVLTDKGGVDDNLAAPFHGVDGVFD